MSHMIHAVQLGLSVVDGIQDSSVDPGIEELLAGGDSVPYNSWVSVEAIRPQARFSTVKIGSALTAFGLGYLIDATPLDIFTVAAAQTVAGRAATGEKVQFTKGLVVPMSLSAQMGQAPTITYGVFGAKNDGTAPYAVTSAQTVPTGVDVDELYRPGDCDLNSSSVGPVTGWSIEFNPEIVQEVDPETLFPTLAYLKLMQPRVTIRSKKDGALAQVTVNGSANTLAMLLQLRTAGGGIAGSGHLTFVTHRNLVKVASLGGGHSDNAITEIMGIAAYDGTNAPITYS